MTQTKTTDPVKFAFSRALAEQMAERDFTQADLMRRTNISKDMISRYVNGKALPAEAPLVQLAQALRVKPVDLLPYRDNGHKLVNQIQPVQMAINGDNPDVVNITAQLEVSLDDGVNIMKFLQQFIRD